MNVTFETVLNDIKSSAKKTEILPSILSVREELHRTYTIDPNSLHGKRAYRLFCSGLFGIGGYGNWSGQVFWVVSA
jgi:hypothetical protein